MFLAIVLLGLVPLAILPEVMSSGSETDSDDTETDDVTDDALLPLDVDDIAGSADDVVGDILDPVIDDDEPGLPIDEIDVLDPVIDIDLRSDVSQVSNTVVVDFDAQGDGVYAEINDFDSDTDVLQINIGPEFPISDPEFAVEVSEDADDAEVWVEDVLVALIHNAPMASEQNIRLEFLVS